MALSWIWCAPGAIAQDLEPRRWTHLPVGTNVLGIGYVYTTGDIHFDPVLGIEDAEVEMHSALVSYNRYFAMFDTTARIDVQLPIQSGQWDGLVSREPRSVTRDGLGDPRLRLSVCLAGAPPVRREEFLEYRKANPTTTILGAAVALRLPLGDYLEDKLINLGDNRLSIQPQLGLLHTMGPWSIEVTGSFFLYTTNDEFFGGNALRQDTLYEAQAHVVRTFGRGYSISGGVAYAWGAESSVNGADNDDERSTLLYGATFGFPITRSQSIQIGYVRRQPLVDVGTDSHSVFVSWSIRF